MPVTLHSQRLARLVVLIVRRRERRHSSRHWRVLRVHDGAVGVLGTESPAGQQQPEAKGRDCKHREDRESKLSLYQEGGGNLGCL